MHRSLDVGRTPRPWTGLFATILVAAVLGACSRGQDGAQGTMAGGGPTPVVAVTVQPQPIPLTLEYAAQTLGSREVELRARVTGILEKRNYTEGARVKAGQSLFTIDPAPFKAALARAEADLAGAQARHAQAQREAARLAPLVESRSISRKEHDDAVSAEAIAAADVQAARARLTQAKLDLEYTRVESPIGGVAGRALKSEGSLVSGPDVLLTTVTQVDPMHVLFGFPDNDQLRLRQEAAAGRVTLPRDGRFDVTLRLADGSEYAQRGAVDFSDVRVSRDTGSSEGRAELPNPEGILRPGQFVRVRLAGAVRTQAFKLPQRAVMESPKGKFVYVIGKEGKAEVRPVEVGEWLGEDWVITGGLAAGDQVIVDGLLKIGPGSPVQAPPPAAAAAAAAPAGAK
jgi:membrane fusion protein (multidrug efflux system)